MAHEWLIASLILLGLWGAIYAAKPLLRKEMLWVSIFTAPSGLMEPLFVPIYWNPPSLFNLAARTGFDIESLIFCFAIGGIGSVLYEVFFKVKHQKMSMAIHIKRHQYHVFAILSPILVFLPLYFLTNINPIYSASIAMFVGGLATMLCRPDLTENVWGGGLMFTAFYFVFFLFINMLFPNFINSWNLSALSGIIVWGVPLEELMFAFTFGAMWSSIYEHILGYRITRNNSGYGMHRY